MKAEVNKTVEVVLRLSEAEAKCLREVMRCIAIEDGGISHNGNTVEPKYLIKEMNGALFLELDTVLYEAGISR